MSWSGECDTKIYENRMIPFQMFSFWDKTQWFWVCICMYVVSKWICAICLFQIWNGVVCPKYFFFVGIKKYDGIILVWCVIFLCVISPRVGNSNRRYMLQLSLSLQHFTSKNGSTLFSSHKIGFDAGKSRSSSIHLILMQNCFVFGFEMSKMHLIELIMECMEVFSIFCLFVKKRRA